MSVSINIGGKEWALRISELGTEIKDHKMHRPNVKGDVLVIPSRTSVGAYKLQFTFPYLSFSQMEELRTLFNAQVPVAITHSMDFPQGNYVPTEYAQSRLPSLTGVVYTVMLTFCMDKALKLPIPSEISSLSVGGITLKLGM